MRRLFILNSAFILLLLISCRTTVRQTQMMMISDAQWEELIEAEVDILTYRFEKDEEALIRFSEKIEAALERKTLDNEYRTALLGLTAEVALYTDRRDRAEAILTQMRSLSKGNERILLIEALLEENDEKRLSMLMEGIEEYSEGYRLKLEYAEALFSTGEYSEASRIYEEALIEMPEVFRKIYEKRRNLALRFAVGSINKDSIDGKDLVILMKDRLTNGDAARYALTLFPELEDVSSASDDTVLAEEFGQEGYFAEGSKAGDFFLRSSAALFITTLGGKIERSQGQNNRPTLSYDKSPVPDVPASATYFKAMIYTVEQAFMNLPDGINFFPEAIVSGGAWNEILLRVADFFKRE